MSSPKPLQEQFKALEHLQELDLKLDQLKKNKATLPDALRTLDQSIAKIQTGLNAKNNEIAEAEKMQRQTLAAMDMNKDRLTRSTGRLESVANSQEFTAANKEIEQLKKQSALLEEQLKKFSADIETAKKAAGELDKQMATVKGERETQSGVLAGQSGQFEKDIQSLMTERAKYTGDVEPRMLSQYDRIRVARGGLGFVPAIGGRCKGCNMMVPPQLYNEIRKFTQMHACPSCNRLLFAPVASGDTAQAK